MKDKSQLENGGKIILPSSALHHLAQLKIEYPMLFELRNKQLRELRTHCGVLEFVAEEGYCYVPYWMMKLLALEEGDFISVRSAKLPRGTYVKFQPRSTSFLEISNPKAVLEHTLRDFSALTKGDEILIKYRQKDYYLTVLEIRPSFPENTENAISIVETDIEVDFAPPLDDATISTPNKTSPSIAIPTSSNSNLAASSPHSELPLSSTPPSFTPFVGSGYRLDGKKPTNATTSNSTTTSTQSSSFSGSPPVKNALNTSENLTKPKLIFGSNQSKPTQQPAQPQQPQPQPQTQTKAKDEQKPSFVAFSGQGYSLREKKNNQST